MGKTCSSYEVDRRIQGNRPLRRHRRRWEHNININFQEVGCWRVDWIELAQVRERRRALLNSIMNFRIPQNTGNFLTS